MNEHISAAYGFGSGIADFAGSDKGSKDALGLAENIIDFSTHTLDSTPLGEILNRSMAQLDERGIAKLERSKIAQEIKEKFSAKISRVVAQKMHASAMVSSAGKLSNVHSSQEFMDKSKAKYDKQQAGYSHKIKRKLHDQLHTAKKSPVKLMAIPLSFIPDGGITKRVVSSLQYLGNKSLDARKARKKQGYSAGNKAVLGKQMGNREAQRKVTKWKAKDIAELGPKLQRNLHKLKQSVALLESREQQMNAQSVRIQSSADLTQLSRCHMDLTMSFHESKHYIEKISSMCQALEDTAFETRAHMVFLEELLEQTEQAIRVNANALYK